MKLSDSLVLSLNSLIHRKLRSWLTVLGIVIGVAAVVALVSIGEGLQQRVQQQLSGLGANIITVSRGFERATGGFRFGGGFGETRLAANLTDNDLRIVKSIPGISYVNGIVSGREAVSYSGKSASLSIQGVDTSVWKFMETTKLESGRYLSTGDTYVTVIGNNAANSLFGQPLQINRQISINGNNFRVVGVLAPVGFTGQQDNAIFIPKEIARKILTGSIPSNHVTSISIQTSDPANVADVSTQIEKNLMLSRHVAADTKDFTVSSSQAIQQQIGSITETTTLFLGGIAAISLIVGGIGIANTMFMSVIERTRQIGVLKALGATNAEVMKLFIIESGLLGLIGGVFGVILGVLISSLLSGISLGGIRTGPGSGQGIQTVVTPELVLFSIGFSIFVGAVSGLFPARRAASLQPVEALRYE